LFYHFFCRPYQNQLPPPSEAVAERCRKPSLHMSAIM
jgi:hypothetical protein